MKIFLSYSFRAEDKELAGQIKENLEAFDFQVVTGKHLGGEGLESEISERIDGVDALITLLTLRSEADERNESTHDWVKWELQHAREKKKFAIVMREKGVPLGGPETSKEYVQFDREHIDSALLSLMKKVAEWKRKIGRRLKVQLLPPELAQKFKHGQGYLKCWVQYFDVKGETPGWQEIKSVVFEENGAFAYINVPDGTSLQIKVDEERGRGRRLVWISPSVPGNRVLITLEI